jgi:hypothetical protein
MAAKYITKQVTKFIPLGGQMIAASLGYVVMKKLRKPMWKSRISSPKAFN